MVKEGKGEEYDGGERRGIGEQCDEGGERRGVGEQYGEGGERRRVVKEGKGGVWKE